MFEIFQYPWAILSVLIWLPIAAAIPVLALGDKRPGLARWFALISSLIVLAIALILWRDFVPNQAALQYYEFYRWVPSLDMNYQIGIDGISLPLIVLTALITPLVVILAWDVISVKPAQYLAAFLILEGLMIGVFAAQDGLLFYLFFEAMLIPMFIIIGIWGGPKRVYATLKFFLYTFLGSIFFLIAIIYLYRTTGLFELHTWTVARLSMNEQFWLFLAFFTAFAVKIPMFPVHTWLPDAHVEAPTGGSIILAAIMLKIGGYGFFRFAMGVTPDAFGQLAWIMIALSLIAVVYIGLVALAQSDMKKLIAYSSISHMGFVTLGLFIAFELLRLSAGDADYASLGVQGAMVQMISHGFISAAMFACVGVLYDRMHSREIGDYGGVINTMPWFGGFFVFFAMANSGLPGTSGFVGEFMVILASFKYSWWVAALASLTLIFGAAYTLWMVKRVVFGPVANKNVAALKDINAREALVLGVLAAFTLGLGLYPKPLTDVMQPSVHKMLMHLSKTKTV